MPSADTRGICLRHSVNSYITELTPDEASYCKLASYPNREPGYEAKYVISPIGTLLLRACCLPVSYVRFKL